MMAKKNIVIIFFVLICVICVVLIKKDGSPGKHQPDEGKEVNTEIPEEIEELNKKEVGIYSINFETQECEPAFIVVPDGQSVNEKYIVDEVLANFSGEVNIKEVKKENDDIIVKFEKNSAPACNVSATMEELMLNCISYSLIDNIDNCENIYFRIEDEAYQGVNIMLAYDEPYISSDVSEENDE